MVNDETLCAYIDGELEEVERQRLDKVIAVNPGIALRLEQLRRGDEALRASLMPDESPNVVRPQFGKRRIPAAWIDGASLGAPGGRKSHRGDRRDGRADAASE